LNCVIPECSRTCNGGCVRTWPSNSCTTGERRRKSCVMWSPVFVWS